MPAIPVSHPIRASARSYSFFVAVILCPFLICELSLAQQTPVAGAPRPLIREAVDETRLTTLKGNTHPLARPQFDLGTAPATLSMDRMLLVLKRSSEQETTLRKLLDDQQDKHSPNYHQWLTPEQFGKQFGPTDADIQTVTTWLQSHGFTVGSTKGRTVLEFSGSASQVNEAFHTTIHKYAVNGEQHWANASDPMIPTALSPAVAGVLTLHNFLKKPASHFSGQAVPAKVVPGKKPQVTFPAQSGQPVINALAPQDYAVIYNITPLNAVVLGGAGTSIGVVGRSNLYNGGTDVSDFRDNIGGCCGPINIVVDGPDPGDLGGGEEAEATLDSTWSAAIAPYANVELVVSASTNTTDGIDLSETYIVENNFADIMTESFSACELYATDGQLAFSSSMAEQAAAQGITYFVSTGDNGTAGCDDPSVAPAAYPISVNLIASTAFNVAVGGTEFNENGDPTKYWGSEPPVQESAISYIPENVWNESSLANGLWSGSGGASAGNIAGGLGGTTLGVPKPYWQSGVAGIPADGVRDLPDVSLTAAGHDPYLLCLDGSCQPDSTGQFYVYFISGTSASSPSFAGIMALVDQKQLTTTGSARQGLANYVLYRLAATQSVYPGQCNGSMVSPQPASTCIFNDVTVGNNAVPGEVATQYQATPGYDMATGLGSVNVANLVNQWSTVTFNPTTTTLALIPTTSIVHGSTVTVNVSVAPNSGITPVPTGDVALLASPSGPTPMLAGTYTLAQGAVASATSALPGGGPYNVTARYAGDATYAPSTSAAVSIMVTPEPSTITESIAAYDLSGNSIPLNSVPFGSFIYLRADVQGASGHGVPTGSVTFTDSVGAIPGGGTFTLNSQGNTANPNGVNFDTGTHTISAAYFGDLSFNPSSTTQSQSVTVAPGFYATMASSGSQVVISAPGGTGTSTIAVVNSTNFNGTITLACLGLPYEATCTFSPASIKATGAFGNTNVSVVVSTTAATAMAAPQRRTFWLAESMMGMGLLFSVVLMSGKQQRAQAMFVLVTLLLVVTLPGCGGGGGGGPKPPPPNTGTPPGVSNITVTATSGTSVSQTGFTLAVQ